MGNSISLFLLASFRVFSGCFFGVLVQVFRGLSDVGSMSNNANAAPLPSPEGDNQPNLNVLPPPVPPKRSPYALSKADEREIALTKLIISSATIPAYGTLLVPFGITAAFITTLNNDVTVARQCSERAVNCTNAKEGATAAEAEKRATLVHSLRNIQSKARGAYEDTNPQHVKDYLTGQNIVVSRPILEGAATTIIDKANADRPGGIDTDFIVRVTDERQAYINAHASQQTELGRGKQERVSRNQWIKSIRERRKKIQRAADGVWPWTSATSAEARVKFKLPPKQPYSS